MRKQSGFTLIELMIVVAIIAVITMIALPAYNEQTERARRSDGMNFLMQLQGDMERHFYDNNGYPNGLASLAGYTNNTEPSPDGFYNVSMVIDGTCPIASCYKLRAVPQGIQVGDGNIELWSNGNKLPVDVW